ncbi:hypothetical protein AZE42_06712 [Rhizopogon vesiculosus]|uniref:L-Lysine epsilon oxidase N-terminal domain-containing protein n=1 Tax=Rhizopogon vesiculosus TaxID=180088 RepID=A0A1J8Q9M4_9AGAM|nr:hypothetical protein AZE42_06712 [Rhizopogon vesiculosus]
MLSSQLLPGAASDCIECAAQAVRFRVYAYRADGTILGEITSGGDYEYTLNWTVHVANYKGTYYEFAGEYEENHDLRNPDVQTNEKPPVKPEERSRSIVDSGDQEISYPQTTQPVKLKGSFQGSRAEAVGVHPGELRTDVKGRLIIIGGGGYSRSVANKDKLHFQPEIISEFDSIDWVDDTCDCWVDVKVKQASKTWTAYQKSTVISAPPKFAWGIQSPTTMYGLITNIYYKHNDCKG